jgi:hypothetical protein
LPISVRSLFANGDIGENDEGSALTSNGTRKELATLAVRGGGRVGKRLWATGRDKRVKGVAHSIVDRAASLTLNS